MFIGHLPPDSATARSLHGQAAGWGPAEHLLAATVDTLAWANWQRGGGKGGRPRPVPRPGRERRTVRHGHTDLRPDQAIALLERARTGRLAEP